MSGVAADVSAVVVRLLDADPRDLVDGELQAELEVLQAAHDRLAVAIADRLGVWDTRRVWSADGSLSAAHAWARVSGQSITSGRVALRQARKWPSLPLGRAAVVDGRLSLDQFELLARACTPERQVLFERDEAFLVDRLTVLPFVEGVQLIEYWINAARDELADDRPAGGPDDRDDLDDADDAAEGDCGADIGDGGSDDGDGVGPDPGAGRAGGGEGSRVFASTTLGGCVALDAWLNAIDGAIVVDELERLERELFLADRRDGVQRSRSQRMAAALVAMATRSATVPSDGRRPQPLFTVLVGDQTLSRLCELANGTVITPAQLLAHVDTALLETVLFDGPSTVVSVSNRRSFMGAVRRAIQVRDRRCRHPSGCDVPASRCDVDHIVPWSRNGPTSQFNGRLECTTYNRHRDEHDHHATPRPELVRPIDRLDEMRARLRWRCLRDPDPDPDEHVDAPPG